jgi:DNA-binding SARP family transcriptional activator/tetratricopeptide (TPR) repeat protein
VLSGARMMRFQFLGGITLEATARVSARGDQPALTIARLVLERPNPLPRDELADLLWPDHRPPHWEGPARQVVSRARALMVAAGAAPSSVTSRGGLVELDLADDAEVDVEDAFRAIADAERCIAAHAWDQADDLTSSALDHLGLTFFPVSEAKWTRRWQDRVRGQRLRALHIATEAALGAGEPARAIARADAALAVDPFDEVATRALMAAHDALGSRGQALTVYEECRRRLDEDLGVRPSEETEAAYLALLGSSPRVAIRATTSTREPTRSQTLPFVGRQEELARIDVDWDAVRDGVMRCVVIAGESGIGKTRLAEEIARNAQRDGALVLWGACVADVGRPYQPFGDILSQFLTARPFALDQIGSLAPDLTALVPDLVDAGAPSDAAADEHVRARLFRAAEAALDALAAEPVLVVIDDIQFADEDALALVRHFIPIAVDRPSLLLITVRNAEGAVAATLAELQRRVPTVTFRLEGLTIEDLVDVLNLSGVALDGDVHAVATELEARTTGNPFYVTQLVLDAHATQRTFDAGAVPDAVAQLISRRLEALDGDSSSMLALAAIAGEEFDLQTIEACSSIAPEQILDIVESLCRQVFLTEVDAERFSFAHALVRDAVLATIGPTRRQRLHRRVADALAVRQAEPALLAHHYVSAGATSALDATRSLLAAGHAALANSAWAVARDHFALAADLAAEIDEQCAALIGLGRAQQALGDADEGRSTIGIALGIARAHRRGRAAAAATLALVGGGGRGVAVDLEDAARATLLREALAGLDDADVDLLVAVLGELALALVLTDAKAERDELAERCLREARRSSDPDILAAGLQARRIALMGPAGTTARVVDGREVLTLSTGAVAPERTLAAQLGLVEDLIELGDRAGVDAALEQARMDAERLAHPYWSWATTSWRGLLAVIDGRFEAAESLAFDAFAHQAPSEHPEAAAALGVNLVDIRLFQGRADEVLELLRDAADQNPHIPAYRAVLALCRTDAGDLKGARSAYEQLAARDFELPPDSNWLLAIAVLADTAASLGDRAGARTLTKLLEPYADRHVVLNCFGGGGAYWGPVEHHLGRLAATLGRGAEARAHLERAILACEAMGAIAFAPRSRDALAALAGG